MALVKTLTEAGAENQKIAHLLVDNPRGEGQGWKIATGQLDLDNNYPTGGYPLDLSSEMDNVVAVFVQNKGGYEINYEGGNIVVRYFDYAAAAAGPAIEVPAATDLSALVDIPFIAIGY